MASKTKNSFKLPKKHIIENKLHEPRPNENIRRHNATKTPFMSRNSKSILKANTMMRVEHSY